MSQSGPEHANAVVTTATGLQLDCDFGAIPIRRREVARRQNRSRVAVASQL